MFGESIIIVIAILILSVVIHEVAHGYAALWLGDTTALRAGRLTLNPIKHLDMMGSIILPTIMALLPGSLIFGWAKPVPYNPYNLKNRRWGELLVAIAGPISNILLAIIFGLFVQFFGGTVSAIEIAFLIIQINVALAIFNLVPIPPLDGSKILFALFPEKAAQLRATLERFGFFALLLFVFFFSSILGPIISFTTRFLTGTL
jgi:Zn-dependent protease